LGGAQIEGRQAVRELLIARKRRAFEVWISNDIDDNEVINDIIELANDQRVPVRRVARKEIEREARSEAPQGVLAMAAPIPDVDLAYLIGDSTSKKPKLLIAVDGVTDPGNLGAILRSCDTEPCTLRRRLPNLPQVLQSTYRCVLSVAYQPRCNK